MLQRFLNRTCRAISCLLEPGIYDPSFSDYCSLTALITHTQKLCRLHRSWRETPTHRGTIRGTRLAFYESTTGPGHTRGKGMHSLSKEIDCYMVTLIEQQSRINNDVWEFRSSL